jgi:chemotaxis protein histidine kinase CheA
MRRFTMPAAIIFVGALALTGCTAQDGENAGAAAESVCETVASGVRDISNGIQNTLASVTAENRDEVEAYLTEAGDRVEALAADAEDSEFAAAIEEFAAEVEASGEYAGDLPEDPSTQDPEELSERQAAIQEAAANVKESCSADAE